MPGLAHAATITVTTTNDSGFGSLRAAITAANATPTVATFENVANGLFGGGAILNANSATLKVTNSTFFENGGIPPALAASATCSAAAVLKGTILADETGGNGSSDQWLQEREQLRMSICVPLSIARYFSRKL